MTPGREADTMHKTIAILLAIVLGGMAIGTKIHELAGVESHVWIIGSIILQVMATKME